MRYFESFHAGEVFKLGPHTIKAAEITKFARLTGHDAVRMPHTEFDASENSSQPLDDWHLVAICMRLFVDAIAANAKTMGSPGVDQIRWLEPVYVGDTLMMEVEVLETIPSISKPDRGVVRSAYRVRNQRDQLVMTQETLSIYGRCPTHRP